jgi:hypothetical protein
LKFPEKPAAAVIFAVKFSKSKNSKRKPVNYATTVSMREAVAFTRSVLRFVGITSVGGKKNAVSPHSYDQIVLARC